MTTKPIKRNKVIKRLEAEQAKRDRVRKENQEYYQKEGSWKFPRVRK